EWFNEKAKTCEACEAGFIKFTNTTQKCTSCEDHDGVTCEGKNKFTLDDGFWMPSEWVEANCDKDEPVCMLERIYPCLEDLECSSDQSRRNADDTMSVSTGLLCHAGYSEDTVLCTGCDTDFYMDRSDNQCKRCQPISDADFIQGGCAAGGLILLGVMLCYLWTRGDIFGSMKNVLTALDEQSLKPRHKKLHHRRSAMVTVLLSHLQVVSQASLLFSASSMPSSYASFLAMTSTVNLNFASWIPVKCLSHASSWQWFLDGEFYRSLTVYMAMSMLIMPIMIMSYKRYLREGGRTRASIAKEQKLCKASLLMKRAHMDRREEFYSGLGVKFLMLIHTACATYCFQLYNCRDIVFEAGKSHSWWLVPDYMSACYDFTWNVLTLCSVFVVVFFVVGLPLGLMLVPPFLSKHLQVKQMVPYSRRGRCTDTNFTDIDGTHTNGTDTWVTYYITKEELLCINGTSTMEVVGMKHPLMDVMTTQMQEEAMLYCTIFILFTPSSARWPALGVAFGMILCELLALHEVLSWAAGGTLMGCDVARVLEVQ
ncbi:hypothetical protein CYMTET_53517, partial [Cymbomonas tetramitiformis]